MSKKTAICPNCQKAVQVKTISIFWLLLWTLCGVFPAIIYVLIRLKKKCPMCKSKF